MSKRNGNWNNHQLIFLYRSSKLCVKSRTHFLWDTLKIKYKASWQLVMKTCFDSRSRPSVTFSVWHLVFAGIPLIRGLNFYSKHWELTVLVNVFSINFNNKKKNSGWKSAFYFYFFPSGKIIKKSRACFYLKMLCLKVVFSQWEPDTMQLHLYETTKANKDWKSWIWLLNHWSVYIVML